MQRLRLSGGGISFLLRKSVVKANSILKKGACKLVANGETTAIWEDPWIPHYKGFCPKPIRGGANNLNRVSDLILSNGHWNVDKLNESFDHETVAEKAMEHLFLSCDVAFHLWRSSPWGFYPICDTGIRVWDWVKFIWGLNHRGVQVEDAFLYASIVVDTIWRVRNDKVHNNYLVDVKKCVDDIYFTFTDIHASLLPSPTSHPKEVWSPPPKDWIKLNCDVKVGFDDMCVAVVARNYLGEVVRVQTARVEFSDVICGEAEACCLAISTALEMGHKFIIVENDSRVVINAINGTESRWALENYVSFCTKSSHSFISCNFSFISRTCNFAAHNVARWAFAHHMFGSIPVSVLPENLLCNDHEV
ncbi:uncharacterized protein LOC133031364 [Cannabis sativa]|uniref:uncharacterized protein LOC133031364 n=1 Tax=Cannabis sativa TaxID=3483 RepID=UPI0029C9D8E8|nr:uncharacterized protein LOC133031364 [Cannabis sativa]